MKDNFVMIVVVALWFILQIWVNFEKNLNIHYCGTAKDIYQSVTSLIPSIIYAININEHLLFARLCAWDPKVKPHNPDISKFVLMRKICKQILFYKVIDTRESDPRAGGNMRKTQLGLLGELGEPSQRRQAAVRMSGRLSGGWVGRSYSAERIEWERHGGLREPGVTCNVEEQVSIVKA